MRKMLIFMGIVTILLFTFAQQYPSYAIDLKQSASDVKDYTSDSAITTTIKGKFLAEKGLDSLDIKVKTTNGIVTLRGQVEKESQSALAEKIALETKGVHGVVNKISVMP